MTLIDVEKIPEVSADPLEEKAFQETLRSQPVVDAVPVEWLHSKILEALDEHRTDDAICLIRCITQWRKEND